MRLDEVVISSNKKTAINRKDATVSSIVTKKEIEAEVLRDAYFDGISAIFTTELHRVLNAQSLTEFLILLAFRRVLPQSYTEF